MYENGLDAVTDPRASLTGDTVISGTRGVLGTCFLLFLRVRCLAT